jgi:molybdate transport system substrate-binding protein
MRLAAALVAVLALSGCASSDGAAGSSGRTGDVTLTVSAAASLTEAFTDIAAAFEADRPGVTVRLNFAGSSSLAEQVIAGAPVDILATASLETMATVEDNGAVTDPVVFATNTLTIAVPPGNPAGITSLADLSAEDIRVARCDDQVPCGAAALATLSAAAVSVTPVTLDPDVKTVLGRVSTGEVDAGLVYATDVTTTDVDSVTIPSDVAASTDYAIAVVRASPEQETARAFIEYVRGPAGQRVLADLGFGSP